MVYFTNSFSKKSLKRVNLSSIFKVYFLKTGYSWVLLFIKCNNFCLSFGMIFLFLCNVSELKYGWVQVYNFLLVFYLSLLLFLFYFSFAAFFCMNSFFFFLLFHFVSFINLDCVFFVVVQVALVVKVHTFNW